MVYITHEFFRASIVQTKSPRISSGALILFLCVAHSCAEAMTPLFVVIVFFRAAACLFPLLQSFVETRLHRLLNSDIPVPGPNGEVGNEMVSIHVHFGCNGRKSTQLPIV